MGNTECLHPPSRPGAPPRKPAKELEPGPQHLVPQSQLSPPSCIRNCPDSAGHRPPLALARAETQGSEAHRVKAVRSSKPCPAGDPGPRRPGYTPASRGCVRGAQEGRAALSWEPAPPPRAPARRPPSVPQAWPHMCSWLLRNTKAWGTRFTRLFKMRFGTSVGSSYSYWLHPQIIGSWRLLGSPPMHTLAPGPPGFLWTLELRRLTQSDLWAPPRGN